MNGKVKRRQERAAARLQAALADEGRAVDDGRARRDDVGSWRSEDGPKKAKRCLAALAAKGIVPA